MIIKQERNKTCQNKETHINKRTIFLPLKSANFRFGYKTFFTYVSILSFFQIILLFISRSHYNRNPFQVFSNSFKLDEININSSQVMVLLLIHLLITKLTFSYVNECSYHYNSVIDVIILLEWYTSHDNIKFGQSKGKFSSFSMFDSFVNVLHS